MTIALSFFQVERAITVSNKYRKHCMIICINFAWRQHLKILCHLLQLIKYNENKHCLALFEILQELITVVKNVSRKTVDQEEGLGKKLIIKLLIIRKLWSFLQFFNT